MTAEPEQLVPGESLPADGVELLTKEVELMTEEELRRAVPALRDLCVRCEDFTSDVPTFYAGVAAHEMEEQVTPEMCNRLMTRLCILIDRLTWAPVSEVPAKWPVLGRVLTAHGPVFKLCTTEHDLLFVTDYLVCGDLHHK